MKYEYYLATTALSDLWDTEVDLMTCSPKTDPVVKLVFRYIIGLRKGVIYARKEKQGRANNTYA
jgi:hypothetical protein